jgi:hypothetical protein
MKTTRKPKTLNAAILYRGPSMIDGQPIVMIATTSSKNTKTGSGLVQTWILNDNGKSPLDNNREGLDFSICGNCKHRGTPDPTRTTGQATNRTCYVALYQGVSAVAAKHIRNGYPTATPEQAAAMLSGKGLRLGSYGDPAAVPQHITDPLIKASAYHTAYTHQHDIMPTDTRMMISADTRTEAQQAQQQGRRTFRVIPLNDWKNEGKKVLMQSEILCPASAESTAKDVTCDKCKLCNGSESPKAKSIAIVAHGTSRAKVL